jgi:hypothetical protein
MVYFVLGGNTVKIGYTAHNVWKRIKELQTASPFLLSLIMTEDGGLRRERELHHRFRKSRLYGEWFAVTSELVDYIFEASRGIVPSLAADIAGDPTRLGRLSADLELTVDEVVDELEAISIEAAR